MRAHAIGGGSGIWTGWAAARTNISGVPYFKNVIFLYKNKTFYRSTNYNENSHLTTTRNVPDIRLKKQLNETRQNLYQYTSIVTDLS